MKILTSSFLALSLLIPSTSFAFADKAQNKNVASDAVAQANHSRVDINKANAAQLSELKGLGSKKAQAIVDYRQANGPFKSLTDLANVKGIGEKFIEKNAQYMKL
ncbi:helix-hairpin-helix domain-containing protein [Thalassotalea sp. HSM 43]|uniref:ComEA family DNA-binding protein n=1 Tax=Thalassotalea sp. HSM 43 TaxID=2552945 RepID=UPI001080BA87|nr:helix-hairpin-helix domain-containing protein [Thalassotalea sp. HSM 43]QBY05782.1 helix-hairpin-helix domain-containing protein [Thalassotalea sp. HSM 43]